MVDDLEPRGLLRRDLCFFHPPLALGIGAGSNIWTRRVAADPEGIIQIKTPKVFECSAYLSPRRRIESLPRSVVVQFGPALNDLTFDELRNRPCHPYEVFVAQSQIRRLVAQEAPIRCSKPSFGSAKVHATKQQVELPLPLGHLNHGELGVVGRSGSGIAQNRLPQGGNLIEIELIGVPRLGVSGPHRPDRLHAFERGLDLGPIGARINP